jgi:hypothetical protein
MAVELLERLSFPRQQIDEIAEVVLQGTDLIERGFEPGPEMGKLLGEIREKQTSG